MRWLGSLLLLGSTAFAVEEVADQSWEVRSTLEIIRVPESVVLREMANLSNPALTPSTLERLRRDSPPGAFERIASLMTAMPEGWPGSARESEEIRFGHHHLFGDPRIWPAKPPPQPETIAYPFDRFDSLRVGSHLNFTSKVSPDGSIVFLHYDGGSRELERQVRYETGVRKGARLFVERPQCSHRVSRGTTAIASGQVRLIGTYKLSGATSMWELHFLGATARRVAVPAPRATLQPNVGEAIDADALPKRTLALEVLRFHVPKNVAFAARARLLDDSHREQVIEELLTHTAQDRAQLKDWQTIQTVGNESVDSNCITEVTYPTEFSNRGAPPDVPVTPAKIFKWPRPPMDPPPTFETRNAGNRCEAHATLAEDGQTFDLQCNFESIDHIGFYRWPSGPDAAGKVSYAFLPHFNSRKLTSNITLASGKPVLLGFHKLPGNLDRVELTIVRGVIHSLPPNR
jgi:hypothetical protein